MSDRVVATAEEIANLPPIPFREVWSESFPCNAASPVSTRTKDVMRQLAATHRLLLAMHWHREALTNCLGSQYLDGLETRVQALADACTALQEDVRDIFAPVIDDLPPQVTRLFR